MLETDTYMPFCCCYGFKDFIWSSIRRNKDFIVKKKKYIYILIYIFNNTHTKLNYLFFLFIINKKSTDRRGIANMEVNPF